MVVWRGQSIRRAHRWARNRSATADRSRSTTPSAARWPRSSATSLRRRPEQTAVAMIAAARGVAIGARETLLVGTFRPDKQSRRRMGRGQRMFSSPTTRKRHGLAHAPEGAGKPQRWVRPDGHDGFRRGHEAALRAVRAAGATGSERRPRTTGVGQRGGLEATTTRRLPRGRGDRA